MSKKLIVLGGGAAGWLTALYLKKVFKQHNIKLIESKKIGILGAGEGSTPHLINFLNYLEIDIKELLKETKGTIKNGINFENWNGDNKKYFHGFESLNFLNNFQVEELFTQDNYVSYLKNCISKNLDLDNFNYGALLTKENKIDLQNQKFSIHFDAHEIANYLKKIAIERGVDYKEGEVKSFTQDEDGNVINIIMEDNINEPCDFLFDCSGFRRLVIGKLFKTPWVDYQKYLPMKKAVPFFLEQEEDITPCTHAIAMKYGWIWKIPLQHRFGSGYIYDSDYIDADQALEEAERFLKTKLNSPRIISFDAGRFKNVWVKNCIAVGLSAGFTEPLEATSLYITVQSLLLLNHFNEYLFDASDSKKQNFNEIMGNSNDEVLDFLYLHYLTNRKDSEFWLNFRKKTIVPEGLKSKIDDLKSNNFLPINFNVKKATAGFDLDSHLFISHGLKLLDIKQIKEVVGLKPNIGEYKSLLLSNLQIAAKHKDFIKSLNEV